MNKRPLSPIMVGTVHRDPKGYARLSHFLEKERPDLITVEISPYSRTFRARQCAVFRRTLRENLERISAEEGRPLGEIISQSAILGIFHVLREPYEWRAAEVYARREGIPLKDIDLSSYAEEKLSHLVELITVENLRALRQTSSSDLSKEVESSYQRARFLFLHPPSFWLTTQEMEEREAHMARQIRSLVKQGNGKKILHVGGWEHLVEFPRGKSLFCLLKDLRPRRVLLCSVPN